MFDDIMTNHLDWIDREADAYRYDRWRLAHGRGLCTDSELRRFLVGYDRQAAPYLFPHVPCVIMHPARNREVTL